MAGVFINYRTGDGAVAAVLLDEKLKDVFGPENVFRDRRTTAPGAHFPPELWRHLESCGVLLVLIGPNWLSLCDTDGRRRIDVPGDYVHDEIHRALMWRKTVIPVLIDSAALPTKEQLPADIAELTERQFMQLRVPYAHLDLPVITEALRSHVPVRRTDPQPAPPASGAAQPGSHSTYSGCAVVNSGSGNAIVNEDRNAQSGGRQ
ncbi:TIR domain-containing protein [Streptomyces sp. SceaMP-e96]|uniref:toll/interleukin-1 receptor domain-containing protein n=1 Tax=unclassified Streptomyces TaxID=2593676 RepID=UPI0008237C0C|nr:MULTISPECIES: toll/interleukin-1 receptor domain-containing protein [unclassified Streptomyces]MYT11373.1 TIR domain-containing protein [Streptomyces sp. SID4951]SCK08822.1 TIR domain-containing protein [Streptomyces sp. SceaMP-e96]